MDYMPIMLNLVGRTVIIVGGGEMAQKKVRNILPYCSRIKVISSSFTEEFPISLVERMNLVIEEPEQLDKLVGPEDLVIIATNNHLLNEKIAENMKRRGILYNNVDDRSSPFIFPASTEKNGVVVSVSTCGKSPSFSGFFRDMLMEDLDNYLSGLPVVEKLRADAGIDDLHLRASFFRRLFADDEFWELVSEDKLEEAYQLGINLSKKFKPI